MTTTCLRRSAEDNAARSQYGGTGLGMSIVSQLAKMNGTITVESTVRGRLYRHAAVLRIDHDPARRRAGSSPRRLHGKRLLAVEITS